MTKKEAHNIKAAAANEANKLSAATAEILQRGALFQVENDYLIGQVVKVNFREYPQNEDGDYEKETDIRKDYILVFTYFSEFLSTSYAQDLTTANRSDTCLGYGLTGKNLLNQANKLVAALN